MLVSDRCLPVRIGKVARMIELGFESLRSAILAMTTGAVLDEERAGINIFSRSSLVVETGR